MIEPKAFEAFQGKFWKPGIGAQHFLTITDWTIELVPFQNKPPKPKLCFKIIELDMEPVEKVFQSGNRSLVYDQLQPLILSAQAAGKKTMKIILSRSEEHTYRVSLVPGGAA